MGINKGQKRAIIIGLVLIIIMFVFPPWVFKFPNNAGSNAGYAFIFNPPQYSSRIIATHDAPGLFIQWLGVCIVVGGVSLLLKK